MKKAILLLVVLLFVASCGISEDCITSSGAIKTKSIETTPFDVIYVNAGISLVLKQGAEYSVDIKAGENFIDDIEAKISGNVLKLNDNSGCNWVRDYGQTTFYVTAPNISEIYSNTGCPISSDGVLTYPILRLYAMDFFGGVGTNNFNMNVNNGQLVIESNNAAGFYISGHTQELLLNFYDGTGRFEGGDFLAESIKVFQRGSNDMIIHPLQSLTGDIYSTGNVISRTHPAEVNITRHYSGKLIYE
jgi:hypothetical protein